MLGEQNSQKNGASSNNDQHIQERNTNQISATGARNSCQPNLLPTNKEYVDLNANHIIRDASADMSSNTSEEEVEIGKGPASTLLFQLVGEMEAETEAIHSPNDIKDNDSIRHHHDISIGLDENDSPLPTMSADQNDRLSGDWSHNSRNDRTSSNQSSFEGTSLKSEAKRAAFKTLWGIGKLFLVAEACFDVAAAVTGTRRDDSDRIYEQLTLSAAMVACIALVTIGITAGATVSTNNNNNYSAADSIKYNNNNNNTDNNNNMNNNDSNDHILRHHPSSDEYAAWSVGRTVLGYTESALTDLADVLLVSRVLRPQLQSSSDGVTEDVISQTGTNSSNISLQRTLCVPLSDVDIGVTLFFSLSPIFTMVIQMCCIFAGSSRLAFGMRTKLKGQAALGQGMIPIIFALALWDVIEDWAKIVLMGVGGGVAIWWRLTVLTSSCVSNDTRQLKTKMAALFSVCSGVLLVLFGVIFPVVMAIVDISKDGVAVCNQGKAFGAYALYNAGPVPAFMFMYGFFSCVAPKRWQRKYREYSKHVDGLAKKGIL